MRGLTLLFSISLALFVAGVSEADSSGLLLVRPRPGGGGAKPGVGTPTAEQARVQQLRLEQWRRVPDFLSTEAVDWSPRASRRAGWKEPAAPMRNPHARDLGASPTDAGAGTAAEAAAAEAPDTLLRIAFIRVDFLADRAGSQTSGDGRFDLGGPDTNVVAFDRPPRNRSFYLAHLEALRRYYDAESYGRVKIEGDVWPRTENGTYSVSDMADFGPWKFSQDIYGAAVHMFRTMMFAADSQSIALGDSIPWGRYDRFMIIHAGSDFQSDLRQDSPLDIPSFTLGVSGSDVVRFAPDSIDRVAIVPETASQDGFYGALNGVIAHENGHNLFGFSDVYDVNSGFPVVGLWSLMDSGNLAGSQVQLPDGDIVFATGLLPPSVDPFHRFFIGDRLRFTDPVWGGTMSLTDSERHPDMRRIFLTSDEYLVLENRHISPADVIALDQDSTSRVVLGPASPDRFEYDALLPGPGVLVWHVDASVIPFETAFRINPDYGFNSNPFRRGISVIEADGLADLGDPGSRYILGSPRDPFYLSNNAVLSDSTTPNLRPSIRTWPHLRLEVLDDPGPVMRFTASRTWQATGWPVAADFPPGGPQLLAVDVFGDGKREVCWAGGAVGSLDSAAIFVIRPDGRGVRDTSAALAHLDQRPLQPLAALPIRNAPIQSHTACFAVSTCLGGPGGRVFLLDEQGAVMPGWPPALPEVVTTAPVIAGSYPGATVYVGCADGRVYAIALDGTIRASSDVLEPGRGIWGRLAVDTSPPGVAGTLIAAATGSGSVAVLMDDGGSTIATRAGWPKQVWSHNGGQYPTAALFDPEFLWIDFDGQGHPAGTTGACASGRTLITHDKDRLAAFCADGGALPGWVAGGGEPIVGGLAAGDPDGDGYAEVLTQSSGSELAFWNQTGHPSPGWPKRATREGFLTDSPPLCLDVDGDGRGEAVAMNGSGIVAALDFNGHAPAGWPLATGAGAVGSMVAADLDGDGFLELVAPDRAVVDSLRGGANARFGTLYAYTLPVTPGAALAWPMLGGDPGRTATLPSDRSPVAGASSAGPYVPGSLKVYPNPARRQPVGFAYQLTEPADVEFRILDTSGHEVASFRREGRRADNLEVWDPGSAPAGLYLARLRFRGAGTQHDEMVPVGVLR